MNKEKKLKGKLFVRCDWCGTDLEVYRSLHMAADGLIFCNRRCRSRHTKYRHMEELGPNERNQIVLERVAFILGNIATGDKFALPRIEHAYKLTCETIAKYQSRAGQART